ncbi:hypothetical protein BC831DRAFT_467808 [Entophlyctis helioformis]|nr:hypothetical protein BC831DRAFT_467808 [Entophlyctis helioformis]
MAPLLDIPIEIVAAVVTVATLLAMTATTVFQIRSLYKPGNRSIRLILLVGNTIGFLMFVSYTSAIYLSDSVIIKLCTHWLLLLTVWFAIMIILETLHLFSAITASITTTRIRVLQALSTGALLVAWGGGYVRYIVYFEKTDPRWFARWHAVGLNFVLGGVAAADTIQNIWIVHKLYRFVEARIASGKVSREDNFRLRFYVTVGWLVLLMLSDALSMGFNIMSLLLKSADKILAERLACALAQISASLFILHYSVSLTVQVGH